MANLNHSEAIDALCGCAATVTVLSYQEAIEGYFKLRGWSLDRIEIAQSQAKEHAALMLEAAKLFEADTYTSASGGCCGQCEATIDADIDAGYEIEPHRADCIVTKLRDAADRAEGEV